MLGEHLLHVVVDAAALRRIGGSGLARHQLIDLTFPRRGRRRLPHVPDVRRSEAEPEIWIERRIEAGLVDVEVHRFVLPGQKTLNHGIRVDGHEIDDDADLFQRVAHHDAAAFELGPGLLRQQRKVDRLIA